MFSYCKPILSQFEVEVNGDILIYFTDGIAAAFILTVINYLILGWQFEIDGFYLRSFEVWLACIVVFPGAGNIGFALLQYRLGQRNLLEAFIENVTWIPFLYVP